MPRWIFSLFQFFPLSLFAAYAFWHGLPSNERWIEAFQISAIAGIVQLGIVLPQRFLLNRLVLAGNIYLILGGLAALTGQWWYLQIYDYLRESAIFLAMLLVGIVGTNPCSVNFLILPSALLLHREVDPSGLPLVRDFHGNCRDQSQAAVFIREQRRHGVFGA